MFQWRLLIGAQIEKVAARMVEERKVRVERAREILEELEKKMEQLRKMIEFSRGEQQKTANNLNQLGRIIQTGRRIQAEQERKLR